MTDREFDNEGQAPDTEEYEVETGEEEDLDAAMREALEAVERRASAPQEAESEEAPEAVVAELEAQIAELGERNVRTLADFENFRKRLDRERLDSRRYEGFGVLVEILPVLDNLGRALEAEGGVEDLKIGVEMIARQFQDLLRRHGVERIAALGEPFDPTLHDAVSREEDPNVETATVAEELQPGYRMGDRMMRPASVRVSMPVEATVEVTDEPELT